jgi:hypothetical protein
MIKKEEEKKKEKKKSKEQKYTDRKVGGSTCIARALMIKPF